MVDRELVKAWVNKADEDFSFASSLIHEYTYYSQICFHFHQAAEKFLKSFIIAHDLEFQKIHDLPILLKICMQKNPDLQKIMNDCKFLNRYYIDTRYPVHWPTKYDKEETLKAKTATENICNAIKAALEPFLS